jgi:hypothetical protein
LLISAKSVVLKEAMLFVLRENLTILVEICGLLMPATRAEKVFSALFERLTGGHRQAFGEHFLFFR